MGDEAADLGPAMVGSARGRRWPLLLGVTGLLVLLMAGGVVVGATVSYADSLEGRLLPGTVIAGTDVGRMTQREALRAVHAAMAADLEREIVVRWRGKRWRTTPRKLGARTDAKAVIAQTAAFQDGLTWPQWASLRWLRRSNDVSADVEIRQPRGAVRAFAAKVAKDLRRKPRDADVKVVKNRLRLTHHRPGFSVRRERLVARLNAALRDGDDVVRAPVRRHRAKVRDRDFRQVLHLDQSEHRLTLFLRGKRRASWVVATGTGEYPTPLGRYHVTEKRYLPTWINPDPTGWGADMPESIPPGPGNPLGLRALNWSAPGAIRFHGTQDVGSLGTSASHGCVRMANGDVIELYDLVKVGAVILSEP